MDAKDLQKQIIKMRIAKLNALGSPAPYLPEEAMQDANVPVDKPHREVSDDKKKVEQMPIVQKEMNEEYAEGLNKHSQRLDMLENKTKIDDTQPPISGITKSKVYLQENEKAPEGAVVQTGPQDGKFYESSQVPQQAQAVEAKQPSKYAVRYEKEIQDMDNTLSAVRKSTPRLAKLGAEFNPHTMTLLQDNSDAYLEQYDRFIDATTFNKMRTAVYKLISDGTKIKDRFNPDQLQELIQNSIDKLMYQEINAWERQLSDHGVRHIAGNINTADRISKAMQGAGYAVSEEERFMIDVVMINHDIGYTTEKVRESIPETQNHPAFSKSWFDNERQFFSKYFAPEELDAMSDYIEHHDQTDIDWENKKLLSIISVSDNLSIFHDEKLPSLFKYVDGSLDILFNIQKAIRDKDKTTIESERQNLIRAVNASALPQYTKSWLVKAAREVSEFTPKFTIPMLIGRIDGFNFNKDTGLAVDVQEDMFDTRVADFYDMGQKAYVKLAESYKADLANNDQIQFKRGDKQLMQVNIKREKLKKSLDIESIDIFKDGEPKEGLVPKKIVVRMKNGKTYERTQLVRPDQLEGLPMLSKDPDYEKFLHIEHNSLIDWQKKKIVSAKIEALTQKIDADRKVKMGNDEGMAGYFMVDGWAEGAFFKIVGMRMLAAELSGKIITDDNLRAVWEGALGEKPTDHQIEYLKMFAATTNAYIDKKGELSTDLPKQMLQNEMKYAKQRTKELFGDKIRLYRGIYGPAAVKIKEAMEKGEELELDDLPLSSYSQDYIAAFAFIQDRGHAVVITRDVDADDVAFAWYSNPALLHYLPAQKEVVIDPKINKFKVNRKDVEVWS